MKYNIVIISLINLSIRIIKKTNKFQCHFKLYIIIRRQLKKKILPIIHNIENNLTIINIKMQKFVTFLCCLPIFGYKDFSFCDNL